MAGEEPLLRANTDGDDSRCEGAIGRDGVSAGYHEESLYIPADRWTCVSAVLPSMGLHGLMALETPGDGFLPER